MRSLCQVTIALTVSLLVVLPGIAPGAKPRAQERDAEALVQRALRAEVEGDNTQREELLQQALSLSANCPQALWQLGKVRIGTRWLPTPEACEKTRRDPRWIQYQQLRERLAASSGLAAAQTHVALARWCDLRGLKTQGAYHWYRVLQMQPLHPGALNGLKAVWHQSQLLPVSVLENLKRRERVLPRLHRQWEERLQEWADHIAQPNADPESTAEALKQFRGVTDPDAIDPLLDVIAKGHPKMAREAIGVLGNMAAPAAALALADVAVFSEAEEFREAAIAQLSRRPLHEYAPQLLAAFQKPLESTPRITVSPEGHVTYNHEVFREGPEANRLFTTRKEVVLQDSPGITKIIRSRRFGDHVERASPREKAEKKRKEATSAIKKFAQSARKLEAQVEQANSQTAHLNKRIRDVLTQVVHEDLGPDAEDWWNWWLSYNEVEPPITKPTLRQYSSEKRVIKLVTTEWRSCFPAGTPVHTNMGLVAIERLKVGDLVLAQDVDSGELAYKPILMKTIRLPCPTLRLKFEEDADVGDAHEIVATRGHPFWLTGHGWRMAKLLQPGERLRGIGGSWTLTSIREMPQFPAHNLIVGDFHTYFVGRRGLLVHDNSLRRPTTAIVPGLHRKSLSQTPGAGHRAPGS